MTPRQIFHRHKAAIWPQRAKVRGTPLASTSFKQANNPKHEVHVIKYPILEAALIMLAIWGLLAIGTFNWIGWM